MTDLSIIIVNYRSWVPLGKCLDSILNQKKLKAKILVLDNNSDDNIFNDFKKKYSSVEWFKNDENLGFAKACNIGSKKVKSKWILFLNPDTLIPENCFENLANKVKDSENEIISIKQLNEKEIDTHAYGIFLNLYSLNGIFRFIYRLLYGLSKKTNSAKLSFSPDWISGSFMLIKRKDFIRIGGWDENFWMYYEDMDICKRAKKYGISTKFYNDLYCYHFHGKSSRIDLETKIKSKSQVIKSSFIFINKHYHGLHGIALYFLLRLSILTELFLLSPFLKEKRGILKKILDF
jgi:GT2 family glycosyltransferase